ncbi:MAG: hypothetical protein AAB337_03735 [Patescibacteria group bacterium]
MEDEAKKEILEAINVFSSAVDKQFGEIKSEMTEMKSEMTEMKSEMTEMKSEMTEMKSVMVTKDFLQDQLGLLKGDLTVMMRGENKKIIALVEIMEKKQLLTRDEARAFYEMEPFPKLMI